MRGGLGWVVRLGLLAVGLMVSSLGYGRTVEIGTLPGLRYDVAWFSVLPGEEVELVLRNDDEMLHNLVITVPGARLEVVNAAVELGAEASQRDYVPEMAEVLWATPVVASGAEARLRFTAPMALGDYPFVCTFPGHGFVMFGKMVVSEGEQEVVLAEAYADSMEPAGHGMHVGKDETRAVVLRRFMPDAGPASIAVGLPGGYSYCWDAGAVRFRYAWKGGFAKEVYRKPMELVGDVFYREETGYPLRNGADAGELPRKVRFLGYGLDEDGYPEFEYLVDGVTVCERTGVEDGRLVRRFALEGDADGRIVWFAIPDGMGERMESSGRREGDFFVFEGEASRAFFVSIGSEGAVN